MPGFWQFPTVSMGLGPISAIYLARFNRYLHARGIKDTSGQRIWGFLGDRIGESISAHVCTDGRTSIVRPESTMR